MENKINLHCIIVIYNANISESVTFNNIVNAKLEYCRIIVMDNSDNIDFKVKNKETCKSNSSTYIDMGGDLGLSKAFNAGIDYLYEQSVSQSDIVVFLNDDTDITKEFLLELPKIALKETEFDVFAPIMQGQNGILYSPARQGFFKNKYPKTIDEEIPQNKFFAIASCCSCRLSIFNDYRFDENIFMDVIDNDFCYEQRKKGTKFYKINVVIQQKFFLKSGNLTYKSLQGRLKFMLPDLWVFCKKKPLRMLGYLPDVVARGIMYSYQTKSIKMWFWMMGYALKCMTNKK